jgi:phosphatidylglycerol lysyltransferase
MAGYVGLGWWIERPIRLFGYPLHLPRPRTAGAQIALSVADLSLVAAVLYACLPHASAVGYPHVLAVYVLAFVAGLISHVPGGLGVFDAVVVVGLSARLPADQILAGLLAFRVMYQLVPLVGAGVLFGAVEALAARRLFAQTVANISIWVGAIGPTVLAGCTFTGGVVLLFSNAMPVSDARLRLVETVLPLTVLETSHFMGSIDGVLLLLFAYGMQQRLRWAWALSAVLLCAGAVSLMLKGFAWEEAIALLLLLLALLPARREFYLSTSPPSQQYAFGWFVAIAVVLAAAFWLGLFSYKHLDEATMPHVSYELRSQSRSSRLVRRPIARSARCGIDAPLFAAERRSSCSARRSSGDDRHEPLQSRALFRPFRISAESGSSKYATDDRGQKDRRGGQEQSGNNLFFSEQRRVEQPVCQVDGAHRIWRTAISTTVRR